MVASLESVFNPRSVAVIGASGVPGKAAERRTRSLFEGGYVGDVYLVNPKRSELFGKKVYAGITAVEKEVDLAMVVVAPRFLVSSVADSVKMGAKGIIIITAGLGETGEEGRKIEAQILNEAAKTGACVIGPNCSGMFSASANISLGNAIGASFPDYIDYLKDDSETRVIITYLEGIKDGNRLVRAVRETIKNKPVIALKVGRSAAGARAAASHTGSLAGDDLIVDAAFRQAGIVRVANIDELFDMAEVFCNCPLPEGNRVAILSEGGGDNSIAADNAEIHGMQVPMLSGETQEKIKPFLLAGMPAANPIDYGGTAEENPRIITECVKVCMASNEIDGIYITGFFGGFKDIIAPHVAELEEQTSRELVELVNKYNKPLFVHTSFAEGAIESLAILKNAGVPVMASSQRSSQCLSAFMHFALNRKKIGRMKFPEKQMVEHPGVKKIFAKARREKRANLLETESRDILKRYGLPLPEAALIGSVEEIGKAAGKFSYPLAMKIVCPDIIHKSDAGGIRLGLKNEAAVRKAFKEIIANAGKFTTKERVLGTLISPMVATGQECIIGMIRDPQFGPVIMFGLGGIFVEVLKDVSFRVAPLADEDIDEMIREIKGYKVLAGIRGEKPKDTGAIRNILARLSDIAIDNPEIIEIDLNPVIVHEKGASIVDSRMILEES
jgi:acetyltransferase